MANISIKTDLKDYSPVYNNMEVSVESIKKFFPSFRYIFDLYITGVAGFVRFKVDPEPSGAFGIFDFHREIEEHVKAYILTLDPAGFTGGFTQMEDSIVEFQIKYGEEFRLTVNDPIVEYPDDLIGTTKYAYESSLPYDEWVDFDFDDIDLNVNGQWLTTNKDLNRIAFDAVGYSGVITSDDTVPEYLEIKTYDSAGLLLGTWRAQNILPSTFQGKMLLIPVGTFNLNQITTGLVLGAQPIIISTVASYTLQVLDAAFASVTGLLTYTIEEECEYPLQRLLFENKFGAFDGFTFNLISRVTNTIQRKSFKFNPTRIDGAGTILHNHADRTNVDYLIKSSKEIVLNADWITEEESIWLQELIESPEIYLDGLTSKGIHQLYSFKGIKTNIYPIKTKKVDKLFNIDIIITFSNENYRQRK